MPDFKPKKIVICGLGLLGGSIGLSMKRSGFSGRIVGVSSPAAIKSAIDIGCIDEGFAYEQLQEAIEDADILFICSPISAILSTINETLTALRLPNGLIVTDVGSTKASICDAAASALPTSVIFIGGHPMAGSEKSGVGASDQHLFQNALYVLTPSGESPSETESRFADFLSLHLGCRTAFIAPIIHDRITAAISHAPHILSVALMHCAMETQKKIPETFSLAAGSFRDMTRISMSPSAMWHDIFESNKDPILEQVDSYITALKESRTRIESGTFAEWFDEAGRLRRSLPFPGKGFSSPLSEIIVSAPDKPGILARLTTVLASHSINIKDIEVLKVRENESGTIRFGFDSNITAARAAAIFTDLGFTARERTA